VKPAGLSRVTAWRLGASREALVATLLRELAADYREAMWPALVGPGDARQRLDRALDALFDVIDAHLPLLLASDQVFHRAQATRINFNEPFTRLFEDGAVDGSLIVPGGRPARAGGLNWPGSLAGLDEASPAHGSYGRVAPMSVLRAWRRQPPVPVAWPRAG
jgi:AcrR family transcriptional regulator